MVTIRKNGFLQNNQQQDRSQNDIPVLDHENDHLEQRNEEATSDHYKQNKRCWAISRVKCNKRSGVVIENFRHDFVRGLGIQRQARAPVHQSGNIVQAGLADG